MSIASAMGVGAKASTATRWTQLLSVILCMIMIANLQYGWTLFVNPINKTHGWSIAAIQFAYSVFIALHTWLTPLERCIAAVRGPKLGPNPRRAPGGLLVALGWGLNP